MYCGVNNNDAVYISLQYGLMISRFKMDLRFRHPFTAIIAGPTACGKTVFTKTFIDNLSAMCDTAFAKIIWYYDEMQPTYDGENVEYIHGLPDMNSFTGVHPILIILEYLMGETGKSVIDIRKGHITVT
jgi:hypothetical protein